MPVLTGSAGSHMRHSWYASCSPLRPGTASTASRGDVTGKRSKRSCARIGRRERLRSTNRASRSLDGRLGLMNGWPPRWTSACGTARGRAGAGTQSGTGPQRRVSGLRDQYTRVRGSLPAEQVRQQTDRGNGIGGGWSGTEPGPQPEGQSDGSVCGANSGDTNLAAPASKPTKRRRGIWSKTPAPRNISTATAAARPAWTYPESLRQGPTSLCSKGDKGGSRRRTVALPGSTPSDISQAREVRVMGVSLYLRSFDHSTPVVETLRLVGTHSGASRS